MNRHIILFLLLFIPFSEANAQEINKSYHTQGWLQYYSQIKIKNKYSIVADIGIRSQSNPVQLSQSLIRTGLSYSLNSNINFTLGIALFETYKTNRLSKNEYRVYEEILFKQKLFKFNLQHRMRLEQRAFHNRETELNNYNNRLRYRFNITYPLLQLKDSTKTFSLIAGDELFINFGKPIIYNFDQNRIIFGLGYTFSKSLQLNLNYVHQFAQKSKPQNLDISEIIWIGITQKFD